MTKLKTLKDIKIDGFNGRIRLKAEAIKWVKNWDIQTEKLKAGTLDKMLMTSLVAQINIFLYFFNITEEDLKDAKGRRRE